MTALWYSTQTRRFFVHAASERSCRYKLRGFGAMVQKSSSVNGTLAVTALCLNCHNQGNSTAPPQLFKLTFDHRCAFVSADNIKALQYSFVSYVHSNTCKPRVRTCSETLLVLETRNIQALQEEPTVKMLMCVWVFSHAVYIMCPFHKEIGRFSDQSTSLTLFCWKVERLLPLGRKGLPLVYVKVKRDGAY